VDISVSGYFTSYAVSFFNFSMPPATVSFNGFVDAAITTDGDTTEFKNSLAAQLAPGGETDQSVTGSYNLSTTYSNVGFWIGTGLLNPYEAVTGFPPLINP
jgi:hypothetical protein